MLSKNQIESVIGLAPKRECVGQSGQRTQSFCGIPRKSNFPAFLGSVGEQTINSAETMNG